MFYCLVWLSLHVYFLYSLVCIVCSFCFIICAVTCWRNKDFYIYEQGPQFSAAHRILSQATEFAHFRGISMFSGNFAEFGTGWWYRGQIRHILVEFRPPYCMYTWFHCEIHDGHSGSDRRNTENIELSLSEILPASVSCSYRRKILYIWSGPKAIKNELLYVKNLPRWAA